MKRNFNEWFCTMKDNIATLNYYTDFKKVFSNVEKIKVELNILNSLIGSHNIESEFKSLLTKYPNTLKAIPILLAKREKEIKINGLNKEYIFDFEKQNYTISDYIMFMRKTGLFNLIENHIINNLVDYVTGIEVGMDTNSRKNRTGDIMEDLVEQHFLKLGLIKNKNYFKEMTKTEIENKFHIDLSKISNNGKTEKRFDFVIFSNNHIYACECNFYSSQGSKLNETARSYKNLALEAQNINNFSFIWFTDGIGWKGARHNLEETFDVLNDIYNINDLNNGILDKIFNVVKI